jgi:hypothetical protein
MSNFLVPPGTRNIYVDDAGNDAYDGLSLQFPKATLAAAAATAAALTPTTADPVAIIDVGASTFGETLAIPDNVFVDLGTIRLISPGGAAITAGSAARSDFSTVQTSTTAGDIAYSSNNKSRVGFDSPSIVLNGSNQTGISINGTSFQIFTHISQMLSVGNNNVCFDYTSSGIPGSHTFDQYLILGTDTIAIRHNSTSAQPLEMRGGLIEAAGANNIGIEVLNGAAAISVCYIEAPTAIHVADGGTLNIFDADVIGDIIIDAGGVLNCTINDFTGTITNNGTINGRIDTQFYGDTTFIDNVIVGGDLTVNGTLTSIDTESLIVTDSHVSLNSGYTVAVAKEGGLVVNYLPTATGATVTAGAFVAGVAATSNPTVATVEASTLAQGDLIQISGSAENDGCYEVEDHTANVLTVRGVGTVPTVESFTNNQFIANASDNATITKINVSVIQTNTTGAWESGSGSTTPIVFAGISGDVNGPGSSADNAIATWNGVAGDTLQSVDLATVETSGDDTLFDVQPVNSSGTSGYRVSNSSGVLKGEMEYVQATDLVQILATTPTMQIGAGPGMTLLEFLGNDMDLLYLANGAANNFKIDLTTSPDTNPPLIIDTGGTNGAEVSFYFGTRNPEGNVSADPGSIYFRRDGNSSRTYQHEGASAGTTGWRAHAQGPASSTADGLATWQGVNGDKLRSLVLVRAFEDSNFATLELESPSVSGSAGVDIFSSLDVEQFSISFNEATNDNIISSSASDGLDIIASAGGIDIQLNTSSEQVVFDGATHADTDELMGFLTQGTNGGRADLYVGSRNPEGNVIAEPGALYFREDGVNSDIYMLRAASQGSAGWDNVFGSAGDVTGPSSSVTNSVAVFSDTTGKLIEGRDNFTITETATDLNLITQVPGTNGDVQFLINDSVGSQILRMSYNENTGRSRIDFDSVSASLRNPEEFLILTNSAFRNIMRLRLPNTTSGGGFIIDSSLEIPTLQLFYDEDNDQSQLFDFSGTGLRIQTDVGTQIVSTAADTSSVATIASEGTNAGLVQTFVGNRDPNGNVTGDGGDLYFQDLGVESRLWFSKEASAGTDWLNVEMVLPTITVDIFNSDDLDALATGTVIEVTGSLSVVFKAPVTHNVTFNLNSNATLHLSSNLANIGYSYSGTGTLFTGEGSVRFRAFRTDATSTGTLFNLRGGTINVDASVVSNWDWGTATDQNVLLRVSSLSQFKTGLDMINCRICDVAGIGISQQSTGEAFLNISGNEQPLAFRMSRSRMAANDSASSLFQISPGIHSDSIITMAQVVMNETVGNVFDTTQTASGSFTAVADASKSAASITGVTDNSGVAQFNAALTGPTIEVGQFVTHSGFTEATYNGEFVVTASTGFNYQVRPLVETTEVAFVLDEAGTLDSDAIEVTSATHGLSNNDAISLDTDDATDYDGGYVIFGVATNTFRVNAVWTVTQTGTWSDRFIDQSNKLILAEQIPGFAASKYIATAFVNNNATANGAITNNVFTDMVFGTGGSALVAGTSMERWKLIDELNGTFEYTGREPFDGLISFDFTVVSSGGNQEFRFKWEIDTGGGFVDLPDAVESLADVGFVTQSVTKTFPLGAVLGDQIKPQITRNAGTSGITTTYATIYATG